MLCAGLIRQLWKQLDNLKIFGKIVCCFVFTVISIMFIPICIVEFFILDLIQYFIIWQTKGKTVSDLTKLIHSQLDWDYTVY